MNKITLLLLLLLPLLVTADDGFLGSTGGNVYPIFRNEHIRMSKEVIRVKMLKDSCIVNCKFWFTNESNDTIPSVYMGFPDFFFVNEEYRSIALRNFTCKVNNKVKEFTKHKQVTTPSLEVVGEKESSDTRSWYCWYVWPIKPHETIIVENSYAGDWGGSAEGNCSFVYLIGTAQTWHGTIGSGKVVFDYSELASKLFLDTIGYSGDWSPNKGMKRNTYYDSTVFSFENYYPKWQEGVSISFYPYWKPVFVIDNDSTSVSYLTDYCFKNYTKERIKLMRNEIYARHGYIFKDDSLKQYFTRQNWYKPDESFSEGKLNSYEHLFVKYLIELEKK